MYFDEPVPAYDPMPAPPSAGVMIASSVFNVVFWLVPAPPPPPPALRRRAHSRRSSLF